MLGLIHEGDGAAVRALESLGISLEVVRLEVEEIIGQGQHARSGSIPFTPRAKKVLELSLREALRLGHDYIGTEHILLGLICEGEDVAAQVLVKLGADLNRSACRPSICSTATRARSRRALRRHRRNAGSCQWQPASTRSARACLGLAAGGRQARHWRPEAAPVRNCAGGTRRGSC